MKKKKGKEACSKRQFTYCYKGEKFTALKVPGFCPIVLMETAG
jgi:hypothetical protein